MIGRLLTRCEAAGVVLIVDSDKLHVDCEGDPPLELIEELRRHKAEVMAALSSPRLKMAEVIVPPAWVEGLARLHPDCPPGDVPSKRWLTFIDDVRAFLGSPFCAVAAALGWGAYDCSAATATARSAGLIKPDFCGC